METSKTANFLAKQRAERERQQELEDQKKRDAESRGDTLVRNFFKNWAPVEEGDERAQFHMEFVRLVQQITFEAAEPYHRLMRDALAAQPMLPPKQDENNNG